MRMGFDFDSGTRRRLGYRLIDQIDAYFSSLPERPVQLPADQRTYGTLDDALPEMGEDPGKVLDEICREMVDEGFNVPSANYFGLMNPTPTYMGVLAEALVAALNPQLATLARSQLASKIPESIDDGIAMIGAKPVAYASAESHHSLDKSAGLLGIGRKALRRVAVNVNAQLDPNELEKAVAADHAAGRKPFCVVATAGTTNSGTVDDLVAISEICRRHDLWLHVDGAYGAAAIYSDKHRDLVRGIERADSLTIDPHKWLAVPFAAGVILTCHPEILQRAFSVAAAYMPKAAGATLPDNARISTQWTRRMNSLKLWLTLRVHGRKAYEELIDRQLKLAANFAAWVSNSDFEITLPHTLPIVTFRLKASSLSAPELAEAHSRIVDEVTRDGQRWISETIVNGHSVLRMMVISYLTEERHLEALQTALAQAARNIMIERKSTERRFASL